METTESERTPLLIDSGTDQAQRGRIKFGLKMALRGWLSQISVPVYILVMLFAISSWIDINGLWVELPLLVQELPEGWNLPSYLAVIIQVANIGPLAYTIANRLSPNRVKEWPVIYLIILIGAVSCLLLAFFWKHTSVIAGAEHSTALIIFAASLALVDCTSSVVFLPYMAVFKPQYMTALYVGEGFSGLIPGLVGLIQSVGSKPDCVNTSFIIHNDTTGQNYTEWKIIPVNPPPVFSVEVFFFFLFGMLCLSGVAFSLLHWLPYCRQECIQMSCAEVTSNQVVYEKACVGKEEDSVIDQPTDSHTHNSFDQIPGGSKLPLEDTAVATKSSRDDDGNDPSFQHVGTWQYVLLLFITAWINALTNGMLASTQSFSGLPYSNQAYSLMVRLAAVANPLACLLALFLSCYSLTVVSSLAFTGTILSAYQIYLAAASPTPPLQGTVAGEFLVVVTAVLLTAIFSYVKVSVASILRYKGRKALLWCGAVTQIGSFVGAVIAFVLVNVLQVFTSLAPCQG